MQCPNKRGHCGTEQTRAGTAMTEVTICPEKRLSQLNLSEQGERPYLQCRTSSGWPPFCRWWCWWHISQTQTVRIAANREKNSSYGQGTLVQGHGRVAVLGNSPERPWEPQLAAGAPRLPSGPTGASSLPDPRALRAAPPWLKPLSAEESSSGSSGGVPALSSRLTSGKAPFAYTISSDVFPQPPSPTITIFTSFFPDGAAALPPFPPAAPSGTAPLAASMEPSAAQRRRDSAPQRSPGAGRHRPRSAGDWPRPGAPQVAPGAAWGRADTAAPRGRRSEAAWGGPAPSARSWTRERSLRTPVGQRVRPPGEALRPPCGLRCKPSLAASVEPALGSLCPSPTCGGSLPSDLLYFLRDLTRRAPLLCAKGKFPSRWIQALMDEGRAGQVLCWRTGEPWGTTARLHGAQGGAVANCVSPAVPGALCSGWAVIEVKQNDMF